MVRSASLGKGIFAQKTFAQGDMVWDQKKWEGSALSEEETKAYVKYVCRAQSQLTQV